MISPNIDLPATLTEEGRDQAISYLRSYFAQITPSSGYTGSRFERLGGGGDRPGVMNEFTAEDIAAVTLLSVRVPGSSALQILEDRRSRLTDLLNDIPTDQHLVDVDPADIAPSWSPWRLEAELMSIHGLGPTTVSKLIARKRPKLVPVFDTLVNDLLRPVGGFWASINLAIRRNDNELNRHLVSLRGESGIGEDISPLRVLDVVAWRTARDAAPLVTSAQRIPAGRDVVDAEAIPTARAAATAAARPDRVAPMVEAPAP